MHFKLGFTCVLLSVAASAAAQSPLTFEQAIERARTLAPEIVAATARVGEAQARVTSASVRFRDNPAVEIDAGPRIGAFGDRSADVSGALGQTFETGGQRQLRIASAESDVVRERAAVDEVSRQIVRDVAVAYVRALGAQERARLLADSEEVAQALQTASERRYDVGDIAALDVNLTRITAARAAAERMRAAADLSDTLRPLKLALGLAARGDVVLTGSLDRSPAAPELLATAILASPVLRATDAEMAQAESAAGLAHASRRPDLTTRIGVKREQGDRIVTAGITVAIPAFGRGRGEEAEALARSRRLASERIAVQRAIELEVETGLRAYQQRRESLARLRDVALPAADDNAQLATKSFEAGEINVINLLLVRQDVLATRLAYIEALTDAAVAAVEVDARAGVLR